MSNNDDTHKASSTSTLDHASTSTSNATGIARAPPHNFASLARQQARELRGSRVKTPFMPKHRPLHSSATGKDRDLSGCTLEDLTDMLERNATLLESSGTISRLPGGEAKLQAQRAKITARMQELQDLQSIKSRLDGAHIAEEAQFEMGEDMLNKVKIEPDLNDAEEYMRDVKEENGYHHVVDSQEQDPSTSPYVKRRLAARIQLPSPNSKTGTISLGESIALQQAAVDREREDAARKQAQMEVDEKRPALVGDQLRGALKGHQQGALMTSYMFQQDDDNSEIDPDDLDHLLSNLGRTANEVIGASEDHQPDQADRDPGELDDEEEATLNPYRTAYEAGWRQAVAEEDGVPRREIHP
ncbi:hypothetical protein OIO90_000937 [Microbotryomycetes sp. JL221]|nr:hypothetical protein OIO90_000937 [Microbotryomycetes sp. JL221]